MLLSLLMLFSVSAHAQTVVESPCMKSYESFRNHSIVKFVHANRALRLMKDLYGVGDGEVLAKFVHSIQKQRPEMTMVAITELLMEADQSGALCDGSWAKKVALIPSMKEHILNDAKEFASVEDEECETTM